MERFDVFVIGGGGTGSEVAFSLARSSGRSVALAERDKLGGECNHYGCIPTKVMLRSAKLATLARDGERFGLRIPEVDVDFGAIRQRIRDVIDAQSGEGATPFERLGVRVFLQEARLVGDRSVELADGTLFDADHVVLATGTEATIPPIDGLAAGPRWTNREAIWSPERPPASLAVIGTGAVGLEFAQIYARFGTRVTALEALPHVLPQEDEDAAASVVPALEADGIELRPGADIRGARHAAGGWTLTLGDGEELRAEEVLVAAGRRPMFQPHDLVAASVELDADDAPILTDTLRTTNPAVWVAGDATGDLLFTHVGRYEAELVVRDILGDPEPRDYRVVPRVTFTDPEVASVGLTEREARDDGRDVVGSIARFDGNERSHIEGSTDGLVKLVADRRTGELLGGHIVGEEAGSLIHQVVQLMASRTAAPAVARAIHAYPTFSESMKAALLGVRQQVG
ncbi:MAG TPA: NAD(P)/FAD-dependent oxidoreductase [Actinomycetota bacterium]|nr:NAD(P)/FAD-dependent oxidoreductase [Actinomycetota bacterium]